MNDSKCVELLNFKVFVYYFSLCIISGCLFCDSIFSNLVQTKQVRTALKRLPTNRGRGRGKSRGRGRGRRMPKDKMSQLAAYFV